MVGVGSGSALNAFNIGQQATGQTAIGQAIKSIVDNADKQGLLQAQSGAQTAGSIATETYKNKLATAEQDVLVQNQDGSFTTVRGAPGGKSSIMGSQAAPSLGNVQGQMIQQGMPGYTPPPAEIDFRTGKPPVSAKPGGAVNLPVIDDPNRELTPEEEAALRAAYGL